MSSLRYRQTHEKDPLVLLPIASILDEKIHEKEKLDFHEDDPYKKKILMSKDKLYQWSYIAFLSFFCIFGIATRYYQISAGNTVIWDEAHFGKFGSHYLKREFYSDVHPPLGKMLVGLAGYMSGYNGTFSFQSGTVYPDWVNYVGMRMFLAFFGAMAVPLAYMTAVQLKLSEPACVLVGVCMLLENGLIGISRLILLDSMLLLFTCLSTYFLAAFIRSSDKPFQRTWWLNIFFSGVSIGLVSSIKWVGLFAIALVGIRAITDLWYFLGIPDFPKKTFLSHFFARVLCLICVPIIIYMGCFYIHFSILDHSGPGDATMSSLFQAGLVGNPISKSPLEVAYDSVITLRNRGIAGGLLHSHVQGYPDGSKQQQVTGYAHRDENSDWKVAFQHGDLSANSTFSDEIRFLLDGDLLRLIHVPTKRNLHSHLVPAHVSKGDFEVSCYGNDTMFADPNDHWMIEVVDNRVNYGDNKKIYSLSTNFRLKHVVVGCYLSSTKAVLPDWGFRQAEVTCEKSASPGKTTLWNVESHVNELLPPGNSTLYKSGFIQDFIDCNMNMWRTNNALVPDSELEPSPLTSSAYQWPLCLAGIRMTSFDDQIVKFFMMGNPLVFWLSFASLVCLFFLSIWYLLCWKRGYFVVNETYMLLFTQMQVACIGWLLHNIPFYIMGRVLYFHHYYPALFFAILSLGILVDHVSGKLGSFSLRWNKMNTILFSILFIPIATAFYMFMPICYGMHGPIANYSHLKWVSTWI